MGDVAVPTDLVAGVNDHHPFAALVGEDAGHLPQHGGLAHPGLAQEQEALAADHDVSDDLHPAGDRPAHPAGEPHDLSGPVANGRDPVQGARDPGPVVPAEGADAVRHAGDVRHRHRLAP